MYVMRTQKTTIGSETHYYDTLTEMTARELRDAEAFAKPGVTHRHVDALRAHQHVKTGGHHDTPLYVDDSGRIRYARDGY